MARQCVSSLPFSKRYKALLSINCKVIFLPRDRWKPSIEYMTGYPLVTNAESPK